MVAAALKNDIMEVSDKAEAALYPSRNSTAVPATPSTSISSPHPALDEDVKSAGVGVGVGEGKRVATLCSLGKDIAAANAYIGEVGGGDEDEEIVIDFSPTSSTPPKTVPAPVPCSLLAAMTAGLKPRLSAVAFATPPCSCEVQQLPTVLFRFRFLLFLFLFPFLLFPPLIYPPLHFICSLHILFPFLLSPLHLFSFLLSSITPSSCFTCSSLPFLHPLRDLHQLGPPFSLYQLHTHLNYPSTLHLHFSLLPSLPSYLLPSLPLSNALSLFYLSLLPSIVFAVTSISIRRGRNPSSRHCHPRRRSNPSIQPCERYLLSRIRQKILTHRRKVRE